MEETAVTFAHPIWFWSLALVPLLLVVFFHNERRRRALLGNLIATRLHDRLAGTVSVVKRRRMAHSIRTWARPALWVAIRHDSSRTTIRWSWISQMIRQSPTRYFQ